MAFLGALAGLSAVGSAAEEITAEKKATSDALYKQMMLQMRSLQMGNALNKQQQATGDAAIEGDVWGAMFGGGGDGAANPEDTGFIPVVPTPPPPPAPGAALGAPPQMPPAGPQTAAGAPPGQPAAGQPLGQMPPQGAPTGQLAQMGNAQQPGAVQPKQPPRPDGGPSFGQPLAQQGIVQAPQMQAQQQPQRGPAYASLQPQQPQPGPQQPPQPQGQQVAQAGPQQQQQPQRPQQRQFSPERLEAVIKQRHPNLTPEQFNRVFKDMLGKVEQIQKMQDAEANRAFQQENVLYMRGERQRKEEEAKKPTLEGPALDAAAERYYKSGDYGGSTGIGTKAQINKAAILKRAIELHPEDPPADWPDRHQAFKAKVSGLRKLEERGTYLRLAANESKRLIPRVESFIDKVSPTNYPDLNKIIQAGKQRTGDPNIVQFGIAVESLKYVYARILKPVGVLSVTDINNAQDILQKNWSAGQLKGALQQMKVELKSAEEGLRDTEAEYGLRYGPPSKEEKEEAGKPETPAAPSGNDPLGIR